MDGLSKDDTLKIASDFKDERIKIFSEKDRGVYDAMNKGISECRGKWIYFLGSDDILYDRDVLEKVHLAISNCQEIELIYGDVEFKSSRRVYYGESSLSRLLNEGNISHQAIFYNRTVFEKIGLYNLSYKVYADWDLNIRCFFDERLRKKYLPQIVALFNDIDGLSSNTKIENDPDFLKLLPAYYQHLNPGIILNNSIYYKFGKFVLSPFRFLRYFKK
jgi:glycosyltransferase involved in cell wall biosynthesis